MSSCVLSSSGWHATQSRQLAPLGAGGHGGEGGGCPGTDLSNSSGLNGAITAADRPDINGTYSTNAFTAEAERLIAAHDTSRPMYMYLAYEAVHDTGGKANPQMVNKILRDLLSK